MNDLREIIARRAVRFSGRPITLSPLLQDLGDFSKRLSGSATKFRVVVYTGHVDPEDVELTFPEPSILKVRIKHDPKAVDELTKRKKSMTEVEKKFPSSSAPRTNKSLVFSRDCSTYYNLPEGVTKTDLSAQWTWDGFIIIESKKLQNVKGFDSKRLIPVMNSSRLDPCLNLHDVALKAESLLNASKKLWDEIEKIAPPNTYNLTINTEREESTLEIVLDESCIPMPGEEDPEEDVGQDPPAGERHPEGEGGQDPPAGERHPEGEGGQDPPTGGRHPEEESGQDPPTGGRDPEEGGGQDPPAGGRDPSEHGDDSESSGSDGDDQSGAVKLAKESEAGSGDPKIPAEDPSADSKGTTDQSESITRGSEAEAVSTTDGQTESSEQSEEAKEVSRRQTRALARKSKKM